MTIHRESDAIMPSHKPLMFRGTRWHTDTGTCIKDASSIKLESMGNRLCPQCLATEPSNARLDHLCEELWADIRTRGCPCCEAGLDWYSSPSRM
jgi:hypothetical protein